MNRPFRLFSLFVYILFWLFTVIQIRTDLISVHLSCIFPSQVALKNMSRPPFFYIYIYVQRNDFCVFIRINSCRKINEIFSLTMVSKVRVRFQLHERVTQPKKNLYKYNPTYRVNDCAKYLINGRLLQALISNINQNGRLVSFSKHRMDPYQKTAN